MMAAESYWQQITSVMPIIVAGLVSILGVIVFAYQKSVERRMKYRLDAQDRFEKYMHSIFDVMAKPESAELNAKFQQSRVSLRLYAPKRVVELAKQFEDHVTGVNPNSDPDAVAAQLMASMRSHVVPNGFFGRGKIAVGEMRKLKSFNVHPTQ